MDGFVMQDWITVSSTGTTPVIQSHAFWLDVSAYRDAVAWLDVREVNISGLFSDLRISYETAPTCDEALFATVGGPIILSAGTVTVTPMLGSIAAPPLAAYLRWKFFATGTPSGSWDATYRILVAMNRPGYRTPLSAQMAASVPSKPDTTASSAVSKFQPVDYGQAQPSFKLAHIPKK